MRNTNIRNNICQCYKGHRETEKEIGTLITSPHIIQLILNTWNILTLCRYEGCTYIREGIPRVNIPFLITEIFLKP